MCQVAATFESIDCRLDALTAQIIAASDVGGIRAGLLLQLGNARTRKEQAETLLAQGKTGKARAALRHAIASMVDFSARLTSPAGRRQIGRGTRQAIAQQGKAIMRDLQKLLQSQAAKTPRTAVVSR
jgi:hypothetical protein